ncbi:MAG: aquaporin [bacterium]|nr:aquaporin [bacterium]
MTVRSRIAMLAAEFLGTAVLATVAINVSRSQIGIGYFVAIAVGAAFALLVLLFGGTSGGHFNPAVTIGLWTLRKIQTLQAIAYLAVQMLGGLAAWQLANYFVGDDLRSIAGNSFEWKVLVAEAVGAAVFTMAVAAAVYQRVNDADNVVRDGGWLNPSRVAVLLGGGLFLGVIVASLASNAILNPAVALANQSWSRAYIFGPIIGSVVGMNLYVLLFAPSVSLLPARAAAVKAPAVDTKAADTKASTARVTSRSSTARSGTRTTTRKTASRRKTTTTRRRRT